MALLGYESPVAGGIEYKCGGTLINRRYVVTAAHCHTEGGRRSGLISEVVLGEFDVGRDPDCKECRPAQRARVEEVVVHEAYAYTRRTTGANDIALVRLREPAVTIMEDIKSIVLPACLDFGSQVSPDVEYYVAGWGKTTNDPVSQSEVYAELGVSARTMQKLKLPAVSPDKCKAIFPFITDLQFCFGGIEGICVVIVV